MKTHHSYHEPGDVVLAVWQEQVEQAQENPWLASLLLRQGERILRRFAYFYEQLRALPRNTRRRVQKQLATTLAGAALLLALAGPVVPAAHAATITVDGTVCTLAEAITSANNDNAAGNGCMDGSGTDTINLQTDVMLGSALPYITSSITLEGNNYTIDGNNSARVLQVSGGDLTLNNATITGGSTVFGGGIRNSGGTVTVNNSTISGNSATNGGGILNGNGTMTLNNSTVSGNSATVNGGGIYSTATFGTATLTLNNSTVSGNSASNGGGIFNYAYAGTATVNLNRSLVSGNTAANGDEVWNGGTGVRPVNGNNYNLFGDNSNNNAAAFLNFTPGASDITATSDGANPTALASILNTTLANNGTQPHPFTHALVSGSPAIDVIPTTDANCNPGSSVDQRGGARANGVNQGGGACDAGAFEYASTQTPTAITIESLTASSEGKAGPAVAGAAGVLALLSGGWLARVRRRKA